jgi:hypothetical protein
VRFFRRADLTTGNRVFEEVNYDLKHLTESEHASYASMIMDFEPISVDGVLYIDVSPRHCYERNRKRAVKAERAIKPDYIDALDRCYCHQVVHRLYDGTSNVLVLQDPGTFLEHGWILEQMARFIVRTGHGFLPGQQFLVENWERFKNIKTAAEPARRELMMELSNVQLAIISSCV